MGRPRVLLVAQITELEWTIKPLLEEWAEVASYDAPGIGDERPPGGIDLEAHVQRALAEIDRRGWDSCVVAGDEFGSAVAVHVAAARPGAVTGLALGHATLTFEQEGPEAPVEGTVLAAFMQLLETDYRSWVRAYTQLTQGAYDDATMELFLERVPPAVAREVGALLYTLRNERIEPLLRRLDIPLLLAEHRDCLVFTHAGFNGAASAFPSARTVSTVLKPSCCPDFAAALREFCLDLPQAQRPAGPSSTVRDAEIR